MINFTKKKFINLGKLRNEDKRPSLWSTVESDQVEVIGGRVTGIKLLFKMKYFPSCCAILLQK